MHAKHSPWNPPAHRPRGAFTLVELIVVIGVIILLITLVIPAFASLNEAGNVTKAAYDIRGILDQARAYAMSNNTYVYVGIFESDASVLPSVSPQTAGIGRVALAAVATRDGSRGYDINNPANWSANYDSGNPPITSNLIPLGTLQQFENLHIADTVTVPSGSAVMINRPSVDATYRLGNSSCSSQTPFVWPLSAHLSAGYSWRFDKVIQFDPQGVPRIVRSDTNGGAIVQYLEISLRQSHGSLDVTSSAHVAVLQIDGVTGAARIYRP